MDVSGMGNNGVPENGTSLTTDQWGNINSAAHFDGINDWVSIVPSPALSSAQRFSITFRFKTNSSNGQILFSKASYTPSPENYQYHIGFNYPAQLGNDGLFFATYHNNNNCSSVPTLNQSDYTITGTTIQPNQWYCVTMVFDSGTKYIYVNGTLAAQQTVTVGVNPTAME